MNNNQKILELIIYQMRKLGWDIVNNELSGIFHKNGITFVTTLGAKDRGPALTEFDYNHQYLPSCDRVVNPKQASWFCEKDGYLLLKGKVSSHIADLYDQADGNLATIPTLSFVAEADELCYMSPHQLRGLKQVIVTKYTKVDSPIVKRSPSKLMDTRLFRFLEGDSGEWGDVQYVIDVRQISNQEPIVIFAKANADGTKATNGRQMQIGASVLAGLFKEEKAEIVSISHGLVDSEVKVWDSPFGGATAKLPNEFSKFGLTQEYKRVVSIAFNENLNYTELLKSDKEEELADTYLEFVRARVTMSDLAGKGFNREQLQFLLRQRLHGYSVTRFAKSVYSISDMQSTLDDLKGSLIEIRSQAIADGASIEVAEFMEAVATRRYGTQHLDATDSILVAKLKDYKLRSKEDLICDFMLRNGQELRDDNAIVCFWVYVPEDVRIALRKRFMTDIPLVVNGFDWAVFLDDVMKYAISFMFTSDTILVNFSGYLLGRDENSFFVSKASEPSKFLWRAVCVNGVYYANTENEKTIFNL